MSQTAVIFSPQSQPDVIIGRIEAGIILPDDVSSDGRLRNFEVWNEGTASFYNWSGGKILEITSNGISITGDETVSGSIQVGQDVTVAQTVTATTICATFFCDIPYTTLSTFVNNPYLAGLADGSISPPDGGGGGGGGTGFTGSQGIQGPIGFTGSAGTGGSGITVTISTTPPLSPTVGSLWWNNIEGQLKIYYDDGDSQQWVDTSTSYVFSGGEGGFTGSQGQVGFTGSQGIQGSIGFTGSSGEGVGFTGSQGIIGFTGSKGEAGAGITSSDNLQVNSLGVGTTPTGNAGEIVASGDVIAFYSDERLKTFLGTIPDALKKVNMLSGYYFKGNEIAGKLGYDTNVIHVGVNAQEVLNVLPEIVVPAPIDSHYLTVKYEKIIPLLIEAIKELTIEIEKLKKG